MHFSKAIYKIFLLIIIIPSVCVCCRTPQRAIHNKNFKFGDSVNSQFHTVIDNYIDSVTPNYLKGKAVLLIFERNDFKQNKKIYLKPAVSVTEIYASPCTGSFMYKDLLVIYYSKESGYMNPFIYPPEFVYTIKSRLNNDWDLVRQDCQSPYNIPAEYYISNHAPTYVFNKNVLRKAAKFDFGKTVYNKSRFLFLFEYDFDNYRVKYLHCD